MRTFLRFFYYFFLIFFFLNKRMCRRYKINIFVNRYIRVPRRIVKPKNATISLSDDVGGPSFKYDQKRQGMLKENKNLINFKSR